MPNAIIIHETVEIRTNVRIETEKRIVRVPVTIRTMGEDVSFQIMEDFEDTLQDIRKMIEQETDIVPDNQRIFRQGIWTIGKREDGRSLWD